MQTVKPLIHPGPNALVLHILEFHHEQLSVYTLGLCRKMGLDDSFSHDFMQDFYYKAFRKHQIIRNGYQQAGLRYLYGVMRNEVLDLHRKRVRIRRMKDVFANEQPKNGDIYYYCPEIHIEEILAVLGQLLSSENFEIMKLYLEGYTYIEIADQLNMPVNTVGTRIHRSKKKLANYFKNP